MKNVLICIATFFVLAICWMMLREIRACQEQMAALTEKIENINIASPVVEDDTQYTPSAEAEPVAPTPAPAPVKKKSSSPKQQTAPLPEPEPKREINKKDITVTQYKKGFSDSVELITFKNNTSSTISRIKGIMIYLDMSGNDISYQEIDIKISIAAGMSKQVEIASFDRNHKYCYHKEYQSFMEVSGISPFKIEFQLKSYN